MKQQKEQRNALQEKGLFGLFHQFPRESFMDLNEIWQIYETDTYAFVHISPSAWLYLRSLLDLCVLLAGLVAN